MKKHTAELLEAVAWLAVFTMLGGAAAYIVYASGLAAQSTKSAVDSTRGALRDPYSWLAGR